MTSTPDKTRRFDPRGWIPRISGILARSDPMGLKPGFAGLVANAADLHCAAAGHDEGTVNWRVRVVTGRAMVLDQIAPGDLRLSMPPREENGWRSECVAKSDGASALRVELVASGKDSRGKGLSGRIGPDARAIGRAFSGAGGREAARTDALHRVGAVDRRLFDASPFQPHQIVKIGGPEPFDGFGGEGVSSLLTMLQMLAFSEAIVPMRGRYRLEPHLKRLHLFETIEPGTALGVSTEQVLGGPRSPVSVSLRTSARRLSDGNTVALSETVLRGYPSAWLSFGKR